MHFTIWRSPVVDELQVVESNLHRFVTPPHVHQFLELVWLRSGSTVLCCRGQSHVVHAGCAFAIAPNEIHSSASSGNAGIRYQVLQIPMSVLKDIERENGGGLLSMLRSDPLHVFPGQSAQRFYPALTRALKHWHLGGKARTDTGTLLGRLFRSSRGRPSAAASKHVSLHPAVVEARTILEHNCGERIELSELARAVNLNERYLLGLFKKASGISPCQFQLGVRADRARNLVVAGIPLIDVAMSTGFADQSHLIRDFKKFFGMTPSAFRKACTIDAVG